MNKAILMGRLTRDPELRKTPNDVSVCKFGLAVDRRFKNAEGKYDADFLEIVAWRNQADFVARYFTKGSKIVVVGTIQTRNWEGKDGKRNYSTEIVGDEFYFAESKRSGDAKSFGKDTTMGGQSNDTAKFEVPEGAGFTPIEDDTTDPWF